MRTVLPYNGDDTLLYSITYNYSTPESRMNGKIQEEGIEVPEENGELQYILLESNSNYGISKPVALGTFVSTRPVIDKGIQKHYTLNVRNTDGSRISQEENDFITALLNDGIYTMDETKNQYAWGGRANYGIGGWIGGTLIGGFLGYQIGKAVGYGRAYRGYAGGGDIPSDYFDFQTVQYNDGGTVDADAKMIIKEEFDDFGDEIDSVSVLKEMAKVRAEEYKSYGTVPDINKVKSAIDKMSDSEIHKITGKFDNGGEVRYFNRHENMGDETRGEILEYTNYPILHEYYGADGKDDTEYKQVKARLEEVDFDKWEFKNSLYGMFDGYDYTKTKDFQDELAKIKKADPKFHSKIMRIVEEIQSYPTTEQPNNNQFGLGGLLLAGGFGAYVGYKIGRARPQKKGFDTEKKVAKKVKDAVKDVSSKKKPAKAYAGGGGVDDKNYEQYVVIYEYYSGEIEEEYFDNYSDAIKFYDESVDNEKDGGSSVIILEGYAGEDDGYVPMRYFDPREVEDDDEYAGGGATEKEYIVEVLIDEEIDLETNVFASSEDEAMDKADELIREQNSEYEDSTIDIIEVTEIKAGGGGTQDLVEIGKLIYPNYNAIYVGNRNNFVGFDEDLFDEEKNKAIPLNTEVYVDEVFEDSDGYESIVVNYKGKFAGGGNVLAYKFYEIDDDDGAYVMKTDELQEFLDDWNEKMETDYQNAEEFNAGEEYYVLEEIYLGGGETITKPRPTITPTETPTKPDKDNPYLPKVKPKPKAYKNNIK